MKEELGQTGGKKNGLHEYNEEERMRMLVYLLMAVQLAASLRLARRSVLHQLPETSHSQIPLYNFTRHQHEQRITEDFRPFE